MSGHIGDSARPRGGPIAFSREGLPPRTHPLNEHVSSLAAARSDLRTRIELNPLRAPSWRPCPGTWVTFMSGHIGDSARPRGGPIAFSREGPPPRTHPLNERVSSLATARSDLRTRIELSPLRAPSWRPCPGTWVTLVSWPTGHSARPRGGPIAFSREGPPPRTHPLN